MSYLCFFCCFNFWLWNQSAAPCPKTSTLVLLCRTHWTHTQAQFRNWPLHFNVMFASPRWVLSLLKNTSRHAKFTVSSKDGDYQLVDYCGGIRSLYLKSKKSNAVIVSKTENCSTSNFRISEILFIRVITFSMFLSSLTCRKNKDHNQTEWCFL